MLDAMVPALARAPAPSKDAPAAARTVLLTGLAMFSISLGVLVGSGIVRDVTKVRTTWQSTN